MDYSKYITDGIESFCKNYKCRKTGSDSVRAAEAEIAESMKDCVDEIRTQSFETHPNAFLASVPLEAFLCILACGFFVVGVCTGRVWTYLVSLALMIAAVVCFVGEFALYDALTATHGPMLQMMTRTTPAMRQLEDTAFILRYRFCSDYIGERLNEVERLAVSEDGHGRTDIIDVVKASGKDRDDEFTRKATFSFISEDE